MWEKKIFEDLFYRADVNERESCIVHIHDSIRLIVKGVYQDRASWLGKIPDGPQSQSLVNQQK